LRFTKNIMPSTIGDRLLSRLEESKTHFGGHAARQIEQLLTSLAARQFRDAGSLLRFHETVLFLRAFPQSPTVLRLSEKFLRSFHDRVRELQTREADLSVLEDFDGAGIAGTTMEDTLSFELTRWLLRRLPGDVSAAWDEYADERAMAAVWPRLMPLLEEDAYVEANIPWHEWLLAAKGRRDDLEWLIGALEQLPVTERERSDLYESLRLPVRWKLEDFKFSRTGNWEQPREIFYHREPLITRSQVSLQEEFSRPHPERTRLLPNEGEQVIGKIREVMAVRYRELYGTTLGDPESVLRADVGRGVVIYMWNLQPGKRLPLRAYVAGFTVKNGVPINYIEAIGLCEWMEVGFNTFYTFRNGETAWIYAQTLRCLRAMTDVKCISIYPYQIGKNNDEAIESGAFWFYRKLGFRPGRKDLLALTEREEKKIASRKGYRTPARTLKKLADSHVFYELPGGEVGAWDRFSTRNIGMRANRRMAGEFEGSIEQLQQASVDAVGAMLSIQLSDLSREEQRCFGNWAMVLAMIPDLERWPPTEKAAVLEIVKAQAGEDEMRYLKLTQRHQRLRREILRLGSSS
jgi:hypothetical protein